MLLLKIKRLLGTLLVLVLVGAGAQRANDLLSNKVAAIQFGHFFEDEREYDVLYFGSSHMQYGISPMEIWHDYGVTGYNCAGQGTSIAASYWTFKNAIRYHKPKVAVLDTFLIYQNSVSMKTGLAHKTFDAFPLSLTKLQAVWELFDEPSLRLEMLFPFSIYHGQWKEIDWENAFKPIDLNKRKGSYLDSGVVTALKYPRVSPEEKLTEETVAKTYIRKFIEECKKEDIIPVLITIPYPAPEEKQMWDNSAADIAAAEGCLYFNLSYENLIDEDIHFFDEDSHLNYAGQALVSHRLGAFLLENLPFTDKRGQEAYHDWDVDFVDYMDSLSYQFKKASGFKNALTFMTSREFSTDITLPEGYAPDTQTAKLLLAAGPNINISYAPAEAGAPLKAHVAAYRTESNKRIFEKDFPL